MSVAMLSVQIMFSSVTVYCSGKSCPLGQLYFPIVICLFVIEVISNQDLGFDCEGSWSLFSFFFLK